MGIKNFIVLLLERCLDYTDKLALGGHVWGWDGESSLRGYLTLTYLKGFLAVLKLDRWVRLRTEIVIRITCADGPLQPCEPIQSHYNLYEYCILVGCALMKGELSTTHDHSFDIMSLVTVQLTICNPLE